MQPLHLICPTSFNFQTVVVSCTRSLRGSSFPVPRDYFFHFFCKIYITWHMKAYTLKNNIWLKAKPAFFVPFILCLFQVEPLNNCTRYSWLFTQVSIKYSHIPWMLGWWINRRAYHEETTKKTFSYVKRVHWKHRLMLFLCYFNYEQLKPNLTSSMRFIGIQTDEKLNLIYFGDEIFLQGKLQAQNPKRYKGVVCPTLSVAQTKYNPRLLS